MDAREPPPLPPKPPLLEKPRGSWLAIGLLGGGGLAAAVVLTFLTLGFFGPILLLALAVFGVIGLQYLVWGWLFERIYRSRPQRENPKPSDDSPSP
jgi:hypothetical protein